MKIGSLSKIGLCLIIVFFAAKMFAADTSSNKPSSESPASKETKKAESIFSDTAITAKVKEKFIQEKWFEKKDLPIMGIHVKTMNGVVHLEGKVNTKEQADTAISIAKSVEGVKDVKSELVVEKSTSN
ncbi:MAG: BON domain-containing protein [Candidatus Berkiellales bacterium]